MPNGSQVPVALRGVVDFAEQTAAHRLEGFVKLPEHFGCSLQTSSACSRRKGTLIRVAETGPSN